MKKRIRKKRHVGEFQCWSFQVAGAFKKQDMDVTDSFVDDMILFVEKHRLGIIGGSSKEGFCFVVEAFEKIKNRKHERHVTCTSEHQRLLGEFLATRSELSRSEVGSRFDRFHSSLEEMDASISSDWAEILKWPKE